MADLSDADKQKLLGSDYKAKLLERDIASGVTDASRNAKAKADQMDAILMTSLGLGVVAAIIFFTNFYSVSAPYNAALSSGSALAAIAFLAVAAYVYKFQRSATPKASTGRPR